MVKTRNWWTNSLEGTWGANSSDKRVNVGVDEGNVVDTTVDVEGIEELQEENHVDKERTELCGNTNIPRINLTVWSGQQISLG